MTSALAAGSDGTGVVAASAATALSGGGPPTLRLTRLAIGSGRGPGGAADDGRIALRAERDSAAVAGQTSARPAAAVLGEDDAAVAITAAAAGPDGNAITLALVDPGSASQSLSVGVAGTAITVTLATDAASIVTTTAADLVAALAADTEAAALVVAALAESDGTGAVAAASATLAGGRAGTLVAVRASVAPTAVYDVAEVGLFARPTFAGDEILMAFWTHPSEVLAPARPGVAVVVAVVVDARALDATVTCGGGGAADVAAFDARPALVDLDDTPPSYAGHALDFLSVGGGGNIEFVSGAAVAAWLHALPAVRVHAVRSWRGPIRLVGPDSPCRWWVVLSGGGGAGLDGDHPHPLRPGAYYLGYLAAISGQASALTCAGAAVVRAAGGQFDGYGIGLDSSYTPASSIGDIVLPGRGSTGGRGSLDGPAGDLVISLLTPVRGRTYVLSAGRGGRGGEDGGWPGRPGSALVLEFRR